MDGNPPQKGLSTGAKVGIGVAIGCGSAVLAVLMALFLMGACTCKACASCCASMGDIAKTAQVQEEAESTSIWKVGETVQVMTLSFTVTDARRQEDTVVVTIEIENAGFDPFPLGAGMFLVEDGAGASFPVDVEKTAMTISGLAAGQEIASSEPSTVRTVFTIPQESTGLILVVSPESTGTSRRRISLGL